MSPQRVKQIALALLCCVLLYIWWGNIKLFFGHQESYPYVEETPPLPSKQSDHSFGIVYRPPQTNPFRRAVNRTPNDPNRPATTAPKQTPEMLHASHRLSGILPKGRSSQVIVQTPQGASVVMELGDSLGTWALAGTGEAFAVFKQGKRYDTLWLGSPRK